jgi:general secretion pathway protein K
MDEDASVVLLDAVLDWRDADRLRRIHGAEEDDYRAAGKSYVPSNAAFKTVDELLRVVGMTPELYRMLSPALTVYSKLPGINSAFASRKVLLAIPGVNTGAIEQYLIQRQSLTDSGQAVPAFSEAGAFASAISGQGAYSVRSEAAMADGTVFVREAVAKVTPDPRHPVTVLAWGEGDAEQLTGK